MSAGTVLVLIGLLIALAGVGGALLARAQPGSATGVAADDLTLATDFEGLAQAFRAVDRRIRIGLGVAVLGLLLAGAGAYLGSDARAFGANVGGSGTNDDARVGGSW